MSAPLVFIDTETTGLDPALHEIWEVAAIVRRPQAVGFHEEEHVWQLPVNLGDADPIALNIGRFHERRWADNPFVDGEPHVLDPTEMWVWARRFVELTRGCHLVGAVVSFDAERLWRLLRRLDECPMWHYHLIDVEALAAGWVAGVYREGPWRSRTLRERARPPWDSAELSRTLGVNPDDFDRHTALGDAKWARAIYDAVMS